MNTNLNSIISRVADRETILKNLIHHFMESERRHAGLLKATPTVLNNDNEENTRKMLNTTMKILTDQMDLNRDLLALMTLFVSQDDFKQKQGMFAVKTGHATQRDVLRSMWDDKLHGRF